MDPNRGSHEISTVSQETSKHFFNRIIWYIKRWQSMDIHFIQLFHVFLVIKVSKASYSYNLFSSLFAKSLIVRFVLHSMYLWVDAWYWARFCRSVFSTLHFNQKKKKKKKKENPPQKTKNKMTNLNTNQLFKDQNWIDFFSIRPVSLYYLFSISIFSSVGLVALFLEVMRLHSIDNFFLQRVYSSPKVRL